MTSSTHEGGKTVVLLALIDTFPRSPTLAELHPLSLHDSITSILRGIANNTKSYLTWNNIIRLIISFETRTLVSNTCRKTLLILRPDYNLGTFFSVADVMAAPSSALTRENIS